MRYITFDTETTGFSYSKDRIIEFGAVLIEDDIIIDRYSTRIYTSRKSSPGALAVHGITLEMLKDEPKFEDVADDIVTFLSKGECIIAHNAKFDIGFLMHSFWRMSNKEPFDIFKNMLALCTKAYSTKFTTGGNSLDDLAGRLGADKSKRADLHGALVDSELLADVVILIEDKHHIPTDYVISWTNLEKLHGSA